MDPESILHDRLMTIHRLIDEVIAAADIMRGHHEIDRFDLLGMRQHAEAALQQTAPISQREVA